MYAALTPRLRRQTPRSATAAVADMKAGVVRSFGGALPRSALDVAAGLNQVRNLARRHFRDSDGSQVIDAFRSQRARSSQPSCPSAAASFLDCFSWLGAYLLWRN